MNTFKKILTVSFVALTVNSNAQSASWDSATNGIKLTPVTANAGIGLDPNTKAKLLLYNSKSAVSLTDTIFGLHTTTENTNNNLKPPMYGAYFKNTQSGGPSGTSGWLYGIYLNNSSSMYHNLIYGVYAKNNITGSYTGTAYGFYANNTGSSVNGGSFYGAYLNNNRSANSIPSATSTVYGVYSTNTNNAIGPVYGAYLLAKSSTSSSSVYGIYSTVSGGNANERWSGYFTGGNVAVMEGYLGVGIANPAAKLHVHEAANPNAVLVKLPDTNGDWFTISNDKTVKIDGILFATKINVQTDVWSDHVFAKDYNLRSLAEVEEFIKTNNHLPDVPSEREVKENGIDIADMNALLLKKVEELTLYVIELKKEIENLKK